MKINRKKLLKLYMEEVNNMAEKCDWKTHFDPQDIVEIICRILEREKGLINE